MEIFNLPLKEFINKYDWMSLTLNDGRGSMMQDVVNETDSDLISPSKITAYFYIEGEEVIGWNWLFEETHQIYDYGHDDIIEECQLTYMCYVKEKFRRRGIGKLLYMNAVKVAEIKGLKLRTYPHDEISKVYFEKCDDIKSNVKDYSCYC